jgi:hypothetical protein
MNSFPKLDLSPDKIEKIKTTLVFFEKKLDAQFVPIVFPPAKPSKKLKSLDYSPILSEMNRHIGRINTTYEQVVQRHGFPKNLFSNNHKFIQADKYLSFWHNEEALSDLIVTMLGNSKSFWKQFCDGVMQASGKENLQKAGKLSKIDREQILANSSRKRSDIRVEFYDKRGESCVILIEHKIRDNFNFQKILNYIATDEYSKKSRCIFVLLTSKDSDNDIINENTVKLEEHFKGYCVLNHLEIMQWLYNSLKIDNITGYQFVVVWLYEIVKYYCQEKIIREGLNFPYGDPEDDVWDKTFFLNILGGL